MSTTIYSSMWYNLDDMNDRKTVAFLLQHSQRRIRFSAYGVYDLSMETFSGVGFFIEYFPYTICSYVLYNNFEIAFSFYRGHTHTMHS